MPNRLAQERSPYLRMHGDDPVDWYPWGEEAFAAARETGRPIFLSIGYASCHWCHVMHRESFAEPDTARMLNELFVSVKVDREVRPDVDETYMAYVVASTGHGGWPMSVFLTPELVPVFGGTYFPPVPGYGVPAFTDVLGSVASAFESADTDIKSIAGESLEYLRSMFAPLPRRELTPTIAEDACHSALAHVDSRNGGFGRAPKFPQAPVTDFLLAYHRATGERRALDAVEAAAEGMVRGGIFDQAGGGIARYAVDAIWLVPHFEKMLYDNAQLLTTLAALHELSPRDEWAHAIQQTISFMDRDLLLPAGGYASSLDADTEGHEGATYVWPYSELEYLLSSGELELAQRQLGASPEGNWEGTNILTRRWGRDEEAEQVDALLTKLLTARGRRAQPGLDDKPISSWNALAARGLMDAGRALGEESILRKGVYLVRLLLERAVGQDGSVLRLVGEDGSGSPRLLEDAGGLIVACIEAHAASGESDLLSAAQQLFERARELFYDGDGTWYLTPASTELPMRPREQHDNPLPSGASLAVLSAVRLAGSSERKMYREIAESSLQRIAPLAVQAPTAVGTALQALVELDSLMARRG